MGVTKKTYSFRLEESMVEDLKYYAALEHRKFSNLVELILLNYLEERKKEQNND